MLRRLISVLSLLTPLTVVAQERSVVVTSCIPNGFSTVERWRESASGFNRVRLAEERREEAARIGSRPDVWRDRDRLYLALDSDKVAILTDCPWAEDGMHLHLYQGFDEVGRFHITRLLGADDFYYLLIARRDGIPMQTRGLPVWAPDHSRFVHGGCNLFAGDTRLTIATTTGGAFGVEGSVELPCATAPNCRFDWESGTSIAVACANTGPVIARMRVTLANGRWTAAPMR